MAVSPIDGKEQTVKEILKEMKVTTLGYAKNFAMVGAMFSAVECTIESVSYLYFRNLIPTYLAIHSYSPT